MTHFHALDQYQAGNSLVHRLDPRVKLVLTLALIVAVTAVPHGVWVSLLLFLGTIGIVAALARIPLILILRRSMIAIPFALAAVTLVFTVDGTPLATLSMASWHVSMRKIPQAFSTPQNTLHSHSTYLCLSPKPFHFGKTFC